MVLGKMVQSTSATIHVARHPISISRCAAIQWVSKIIMQLARNSRMGFAEFCGLIRYLLAAS